MVTWEVITKRLELEKNAARAQNMIEQAPANIMMADLDFNIVGANPNSVTTLRSLNICYSC